MDWESEDRGERQVNEIARALRGARRLFLATDPDREGEAISWHVQDMLARKGIDFAQYPSEFRLGAFARRATVLRTLTEEELATIPEDRRPTEPVARGIVERFTARLTHSRDNICSIFPAQEAA